MRRSARAPRPRREPPARPRGRDLKAENVLLHGNGTWVLCDFGSASSWAGTYDSTDAVLVAEEYIRKYTTPAYRPPEARRPARRRRQAARPGGPARALTPARAAPADVRPVQPSANIDRRRPLGARPRRVARPRPAAPHLSARRRVSAQALGVLLYLLCYGRLPFSGDCKLQVLNGEYSLPPGRPAQLVELVRGLLAVDPAARTDIDDVLRRLERASASLPEAPGEALAGRAAADHADADADALSGALPAAPASPAPAAREAVPGVRSGGSPAHADSWAASPEARWPREASAPAATALPRSSTPDIAGARSAGAQSAPAGAGRGGAAGAAEVAALRQQLAALSAANAELSAAAASQQATIRALQARRAARPLPVRLSAAACPGVEAFAVLPGVHRVVAGRRAGGGGGAEAGGAGQRAAGLCCLRAPAGRRGGQCTPAQRGGRRARIPGRLGRLLRRRGRACGRRHARDLWRCCSPGLAAAGGPACVS